MWELPGPCHAGLAAPGEKVSEAGLLFLETQRPDFSVVVWGVLSRANMAFPFIDCSLGIRQYRHTSTGKVLKPFLTASPFREISIWIHEVEKQGTEPEGTAPRKVTEVGT